MSGIDLSKDEEDISLAPPEAVTINEALAAFTNAMGLAFPDICSWGLTIGESYVPFDPDEDNEDCTPEDAMCSQVWVRVTDVSSTPVYSNSFGTAPEEGASCDEQVTIGLEVGVYRCFEVAEKGMAPTESEVMDAAFVAMEDMATMRKVMLETEVWDSIELNGWVPNGPSGGQYGGQWQATVKLV